MHHISQENFENLLNDNLVGAQIIINDCWDELSMAQQFSATSISQVGYKLSYIQCTEFERVAVFTKGNKAATISTSGVINMSPNIEVKMKIKH